MTAALSDRKSRADYETLEAKFRQILTLGEASGMLVWDMATVMPSGGATVRTEQLAVLESLRHELLTASEVGDGLDRAEEKSAVLSSWQLANLREMRRIYRRATALDSGFVSRKTRSCKVCEIKWREARPEGDFKAVLPALQEVLNLTQEEANIKAELFGGSAYDALLDNYEPAGKSEQIDQIFSTLEGFLPGFLSEVLEHQRGRGVPKPLEGPFAIEKQEALGRELMQAVGFDFHSGRLDKSLHPFCGGVPEDVRITTRYDREGFTSALMGVLHETGHAMYERGLPPAWRLQPVGAARGMTLHESQSLLVEMQACRSREFIAYLAPKAAVAFPQAAESLSAENLYRISTLVRPGFVRVDADEVTYPAHVMLRYRLEKALILGDLPLEDLPMAWNDGLEKLLGIRPPNDRLGCLQDIHWFDGAWGYFPTYSLGAMTAAQIFEAAKKAHPEIPGALARGDFSTLMQWLQKNVHAWGSFYSTDELLRRVTGRPLDPQSFMTHLKSRYLE